MRPADAETEAKSREAPPAGPRANLDVGAALSALEDAWGELARTYRRQILLERAALRGLIRILAPRREETVLDLATGPAVLPAELARLASPPQSLWGIDSSPEMLALAPKLPGGWRLDVADATALPFEDSSFDVVTASYLLHVLSVEDRRRVIDEIARVLRPAGRVGTITIAPPRGPVTAALSAPVRLAARRSNGRLAALRSLDPAPELAAAGLREHSRRRTVRGYPSLCLVAVGAGDAGS